MARNFSNQGRGNLGVGNPGGAQAGNRSGSANRSNFVARNFNNQGRGNQGFGDRGGANRGNSGRGGSPGVNSGRNNNNFVSRNFSDSGRGRGDGRGSDFNRGNFNNNNFNRNNFSNYYRGNNNSWNKNNNWGNNNWGKNNWGGNNWNRGNWGGNNWNNNWGGGFNRGWGYGGWGGYGRYPFWGWGFFPGWGLWGLYGLGYGLGYGGWGGWGGYGGYGYPYSYGYDNYASNQVYYTDNYADNAVAVAPQSADVLPTPPAVDDFATRGEQAFRSGNYEGAIREWQHAMVDDPNNGALVALMAQALFAIGQYDSAAGSVQMAMQALPENEWGSVVKNYSQLYGNVGDYTTQLKALENARDAKPQEPALRFLLGYHFGYLGYPKNAVRELDKALDLQPQDLGSQKLRDIFAVQAGLPARAHAAPQRPVQPPEPGPGAPVPEAAPQPKAPPIPPPPVGAPA